jgi:hypothetical protein
MGQHWVRFDPGAGTLGAVGGMPPTTERDVPLVARLFGAGMPRCLTATLRLRCMGFDGGVGLDDSYPYERMNGGVRARDRRGSRCGPPVSRDHLTAGIETTATRAHDQDITRAHAVRPSAVRGRTYGRFAAPGKQATSYWLLSE